MPVTNLRFNITSSWDGGGMRSASRSLGDVDREVRRVNSGFSAGLGGMMSWGKAALLLAPAMFTLGKHALALGGGLAALGLAAGAAAAPWIALAVTAARNSEKMGQAGKNYEAATDRVKKAWMDLAEKTAPLTLGPMTDVLNGLAVAIPKLEPLIRDIAPVFEDMGKSIGNWLKGDGFERFLNNVRDVGVPAFKNLVSAGKDFLATAGIGFRAFLPLALDISEAIEKGAGSMRKWAEGGGFTRFLADVKREWPTVKGFLEEGAESLGKIGGALDKMGPGQLDALSGVLDKFNDVDVDGWKDFLLLMAGLKIGGGLLSLIGGLANIKGGALQITGAAALSAASLALDGSAALLSGAAAALKGAAALLAGAGVATGIGGLVGALARRIAGGSATFTIKIEPADAADKLTAIRDVFNSLNGKTATMTVTLNAGAFTSGAQNVISQWTAVRAAAATPAIFRAMAIPGNVPAVAAALIAAWARVRAAAAVPAIFRAMAIPGNVQAVAAMVIASWATVRAAAAVVPVFRATANAGNVAAVASQIVAAWQRVRAAAASVPNFRATASAGNVVSVANQIVAAWNRVKAAAAVRPVFTATVNSGPAVAGAARIRAAWQQVLSMPRTWTATATVNSGPAVAGANAARAAWAAVLAMPRSVTFTVTINTVKTGGATGGPAGAFRDPLHGLKLPQTYAGGGRVFGPGGPTSDRVPAMLSHGEWVIRAAAVKHWGPGFLDYVNSAGPGSKRGGGGSRSFQMPQPGDAGGSGGGGACVHVHTHGNVYAKSDMEFQDMVTHAYQEMKRKGRV